MKRRTQTAPNRSARPSPKNPTVGCTPLGDLFPGLDSLSDIEGTQTFFQMFCLAPSAEKDLAYLYLSAFVESRGLQLIESGNGFKGFTVFYLQRKDGDGAVIASFSAEFR